MKFRNQYYFLSNMCPCDIQWEGRIFKCSETIYQMEKCKNDADKKKFYALDGFQAKRFGRRFTIRDDWLKIRDNRMFEILLQKFSDKELMNKLIAVEGDIVEDNYWNDTYWGKCNGKGLNKLGKMLMEIRDMER